MKKVGLLTSAALSVVLAAAAANGPAQAQFAPIKSSSGVGRGADAEFIRPKGANPRAIDFVTDEVTMPGLSVSPKGDAIIFDLLGHIYRLPISGGKAESLTQASGIAVNAHPRFSPDGKKIVFASDRGGQDNLWVMNADGSDARILHENLGHRFTDPAWSPDGKTIVAVRNMPSPGRGWHRRTWSLALVPAAGGAPKTLLAGDADQFYAPTFSPDGRYVYFHSAIMAYRGLSIFQYRQKVKRVEIATGKIETITETEQPDPTSGQVSSAWNMAYAALKNRTPAEMEPHPDPTGRYVVYAKEMADGDTFYRRHHIKGATALMLLDTQTRTERVLVDRATRDVSRSHAYYVDTQMPGHDWTPDGKAVVFTRDGKLFRVDVASGAITAIPFEARVERTVSELVTPKFDVANAEIFKPHLYQWPALSPDRGTVVFGAAGRLWRQAMTGGAATPLLGGGVTGGPAELTPAWSPDGDKLAFATWDDETLGALQVLDVATGKVTRRCAASVAFIYPKWERGGTLLVTARTVGRTDGSPWDGGDWEVRRVDLATCATTKVASLAFAQPVSVLSDGRIGFAKQGRSSNPMVLMEPFPKADTLSMFVDVVSVDSQGGDERSHVRFPPRAAPGNSPQLAPGGEAVLFESGLRLFHQTIADVGAQKQVVVQPNETVAGRTRLDPLGVSGKAYFNPDEVQLISGDTFLLTNLKTGAKLEKKLEVALPNAPAPGRLALTGARIVTMDDQGVIERGTIIVEKGRILCVGDCRPQAGDEVMDVSGKTIIPGLIDMHAHILGDAGSDLGVATQHNSLLAIALTYGVTAVRDPSGGQIDHPLLRDLTESGAVLGPRSFGTGRTVSEGGFIALGDHVRLDTMDDARFAVNSRRAVGIESIKNFRLENRRKHQLLIEAAREKNMAITAEGASPILSLGFAMDGQTGWEHAMAALPMNKDMTTFLAKVGITHSPTFTIIGWPDGTQTYYRPYQHLELDPIYRRFSSASFVANRNKRSTVMMPKDAFWHPVYAESAADILRAGGHVTAGEHGEQPGIGTHWDLWAFSEAMTPLEALATATTAGARFLGAQDQIGSLKAGKLADLVVLNSDPLRDIHQSTDIAYVMSAGRLLERATLDQVWPVKKPYGFRPWARDAFDKPE